MRTQDKLEPPTGTALAPRTSLAHASMYAAQLVIARAINATRFPPLPPPHLRAATAQGRFYAQVQQDLRAWISSGGFSAPDTPALHLASEADCADACID